MLAGEKVKFNNDFRIELGDGAKLVLGGDNAGPKATCTLGNAASMKTGSATDFMCHRNWRGVTTSGAKVEVAKPPCQLPNTDAVFPAGTTYFVTLSPAYRQLMLGTLTFNNQDITSCQGVADNAANQLYLSGCSERVRFNNIRSLCTSLGELNNNGCFCHSSCPTPEQQAQDEGETRAANEKERQEAEDQYNTEVTKNFAGVVTTDALGASPAQVRAIMNDEDKKKALLNAIISALADRWNVPTSAITITKFELVENQGVGISIEGSVTGKGVNFLNQVDSNGNVVEDEFNFSSWSPGDTTSLVAALRSVIKTSIADNEKKDADSDRQDALDTCGSACANANLGALLDALFDLVEDPAAALTAALAGDVSQVTRKDGASATDLQNAAAALKGAYDNLSGADKAAANTYMNAAAAAAAKKNQAVDLTDDLPKPRSFRSPALAIAQNMGAAEVSRLVDAINLGPFKVSCASAVDGMLGMLGITAGGMDMALVDKTRRAVSSKYISVEFDYSVLCLDSQTDEQCNPLADEDNVELVRIRLNLIALLFPIQSHHKCYSIENGYDKTCVQGEVNKAYTAAIAAGKTPEQARAAARNAFYAIVGCGFSGFDANGDCLVDDPGAELYNAAQADVVVAESQASHEAASGGGGSSIGIIAGAAAAAVVIIIIIIVIVVKRRNNNSSVAAGAARGGDRNVVAFENPMYDSPAATDAQPTYDDANMGGGEGLYDEPAFNMGADKANPMYQSAEDLAGGGDDSGYLDVAPEDNE